MNDKENNYILYDIAHTDKIYRVIDSPDENDVKEITVKKFNWVLFFLLIVSCIVMFLSTLGIIYLWDILV